MKYKKIYEFLVWDNCSNNCSFCFQRKNPRLFNHTQRKVILQKVLDFIDSENFIKNNHILICGGEIFDKPQDSDILFEFFESLCKKMKNNIIDILYLNTNLIYKDLTSLKNTLDLIKENGLFNRLHFTSSYDLEGRFKSEFDKQLMLNNLLFVKETYPDCNIVINTILTKPTCDKILGNEFDIKDFCEKYNCWVNLVPYIIYDEKLSASKSIIFKTLNYVNKKIPNYLKTYIPNITITQEKLLYQYINNEFQFCSCDIGECGHSINFKKYSKENTCFCCDLKYIFPEY